MFVQLQINASSHCEIRTQGVEERLGMLLPVQVPRMEQEQAVDASLVAGGARASPAPLWRAGCNRSTVKGRDTPPAWLQLQFRIPWLLLPSSDQSLPDCCWVVLLHL